jgi:hypothetical protein
MQAEHDMQQEPLDNPDIPEYRSAEDHPEPTDTDGGVEEQARALGWKPEDEFRGDKSKWTDAEAFLEVHGRNNGALRNALAQQAKDLAELKEQMRGMDSAHRKIFDMQIKKQKEEFDQQVAFLKAQKREALRSGEHETASDIDEQLDSLRERGPELPEAPQTQSVTPGLQPNWRDNKILSAWADRNSWFDKDEDMSAYAGAIGQQLRAQNPAMPFSGLLEEVTVRVRKAFPQKFTATRRSPVEGATPGATAAATGTRTYAGLPRDAKAACDEAVAEGNGMTQKQWVELYYGYEEHRRKR